jgi:hypothetical protein
VNLAMADSGVAAWEAKFDYNFWRPLTAIRETRDDDNAATTPDPTWQPLGAPGGGVVDDFTPPFPAYVSGHATIGAAAAKVIADFYGRDDIHFTLHSDEMPAGITRSYDSLSQAAAENGMSRIYLGIHWSFDNINGQAVGRDIADFTFAHTLTLKGNHSAADAFSVPPKVTFLEISSHHSKALDEWI